MTAAPHATTNTLSGAALTAALTTLYRAVKALSFYPEGHPQRESGMRIAHEALLHVLQFGPVSFNVSPAGLSSSVALEQTSAIAGLSNEIFSRLIKQIVFLPNLSYDDLVVLVEILGIEPAEIRARGGASRLLSEKSVQSIAVAEIDAPKLRGGPAEQIPEASAAVTEPAAQPKRAESRGSLHEKKKTLFDYVVLMAAEKDDGRYAVFGQNVVAEAAKIRDSQQDAFLEAATFLGREAEKPGHTGVKRDHARRCLELLCDRQTAETLLDRVENRHPQSSSYLATLVVLGPTGVRAIIGRLFASQSMAVRKILAAAVVRTGDPALPYLREALADERWYVVRNAISIMAAIGTPEVAYDLEEAANLSHEKVMKEAIIGLSKINAPVAEEILLRLAEEGNPAQSLLAVHSLGLRRSQTAVPALLRIICRPDMLLRRFTLKREAIVALGAIASPEAIEPLAALIRSRHLFARKKWLELKMWAVTAIAAIDDETVAVHLAELSRCKGTLGKACEDALEERSSL